MKCVSLQIALFWKEKLERPDLFANRVNERMENVFDAMPQIIDVPVDIPVDIPLVQIGSSGKGIQLNVSRNRCDLLINVNLLKQSSLGGTVSGLEDIVMKYIMSVFEEKVQIVRMGIILVAFEECKDAIQQIANKYLIGSPLNLKEINLRVNQEGKIADFKLNNILEISSGNLVNDGLGINETGIVYQRDVNNVENASLFKLKNAKELWKYAITFFTDKKMGEIK